MITQGTNFGSLVQSRSSMLQGGQGPSVIWDVKKHSLEAIDRLLVVMQEYGCFFIRNGDIVLSKENKLIPLTKEQKLDSEARFILANYVCGQNNFEPLSQNFLQQAFHNNRLREGLPVIKDYSLSPVYDKDFVLRQPGYHDDVNMLVHGEQNNPILFDSEAEDSVLRRFFDRLRALPFKEEVDYVNMIGVFLMAILGRPLAPSSKMFVLLDGDEPGLGKTLLGELVGLVADGTRTIPTQFTSDNDEISKRILSTLKSHEQSVLLLDNARTRTGMINLTSLESLSSSKTASIRILRSSSNFLRVNRYVWMLTMNGTKVTQDLAQRSMLVRLSREAQTTCSSDCYGELDTFVSEHHSEILASFYGMIEHWKSLGQQIESITHRFACAAGVINGILNSCGLPGFLSNHEEAIRVLNPDMDDLTALFEKTRDSESWRESDEMCNGHFHVPGAPERARSWLPIVESIGIAKKELALSKSLQGKLTSLGKWFQRLIGKPFPVEIGDHKGTATLIRESLRGNAAGYRFVVTLDSDVDDEMATADHGVSV